jgi:outer membrane receptor protein involved in Fe transport
MQARPQVPAYAGLALDAGFQQNSDLHNNKLNVVNVSAVYSFSTVKAFAGWLHSQDNTGMIDILMSAANSPAANFTPVTNTNRIDDGFYTGATWQVTPPLVLTAAAYYDHSRNALDAGGTTLSRGVRYSGVLLAEYSCPSGQKCMASTSSVARARRKQTFRVATTRPALQSVFATYSDAGCPGCRPTAGHDASKPAART